jgi:hypothetical protein
MRIAIYLKMDLVVAARKRPYKWQPNLGYKEFHS